MRFRRGFRLGRPFGIPLVVHGSWFPAALLLASHFTFTAYDGAAAPVLGALTALAFFACLVAHEMAHALVARMLGIPVVDITLFVFGGVARIGREPSRPGQEAVIASAGPLLSAGIGAVALALPGGELARTIGLANLGLAVFNLLPGFPLDGGRLLRAWLWSRWGDTHRAALAAARSGQLIGAMLVGAGIFVYAAADGPLEGMWLAVVGAFLVALATGSRRAAAVAERLSGEPAGSWVRPFAGTLSPSAPLREPHTGAPYAVAHEGRLAGVLLQNRRGRTVADAMIPWASRLAFPARESLVRALERLAVEETGVLVVVDDSGAALGVLDHAGVRARLAGA